VVLIDGLDVTDNRFGNEMLFMRGEKAAVTLTVTKKSSREK
jgi:hypothetical protein